MRVEIHKVTFKRRNEWLAPWFVRLDHYLTEQGIIRAETSHYSSKQSLELNIYTELCDPKCNKNFNFQLYF